MALRTHDQQLRCIALNQSGLLVAIVAQHGQTLAVAADNDHGFATTGTGKTGAYCRHQQRTQDNEPSRARRSRTARRHVFPIQARPDPVQPPNGRRVDR